MSVKIIRGADQAPIGPLRGKKVAVVGFGNQGHAHALNLRESGIEVLVANRRDTPNGRRAAASGFEPLEIPRAVSEADLVILALPDEALPDVYQRSVGPHLKTNATVGLLHGFNIRYGFIEAPTDFGVIMVAPKGPGATLRRLYREGHGLPCLFAMHRDSPRFDAEQVGLAWANGIGCARAGIICTNFSDETETDLFGEQAVICGGLSELIRTAFETLVEAGYPPELAYLECCHEVKQIADLIYERGLARTYEAISSTAEFGTYRAGPFLIDDSVRQRMRRILAEVRDGTFAKALREDHGRGFGWFRRQRAAARDHPLETAGQVVRSLMPWLEESSRSAAEASNSP
ncbi:MAG: ketol-acid reductoisomerase [Planctomycetota bacterium]|jgi:ketol-acid reductoisomerase